MSGSSPWMLTTTSYFFSNFSSASLHRSVPTDRPNDTELKTREQTKLGDRRKWYTDHFCKTLKSWWHLHQTHDSNPQSFHHPLLQLMSQTYSKTDIFNLSRHNLTKRKGLPSSRPADFVRTELNLRFWVRWNFENDSVLVISIRFSIFKNK